MKIYVTVRVTPDDKKLIYHHIKHYISMGVDGYLINFNDKESDLDGLENIIDYVKELLGDKLIDYNNGPNGYNVMETSNIDQLRVLVKKNTQDNDFIIPTDSDELNRYMLPIIDICQTLIDTNTDYIVTGTHEMISHNGEVLDISDEDDLFIKFPYYSITLFNMPKITMVRAQCFNKFGVGHHYIQDTAIIQNKNIKSDCCHFRWNIIGKNRMMKWINIWSNPEFNGWKDIDKYMKQLSMFDNNMLTYRKK